MTDPLAHGAKTWLGPSQKCAYPAHQTTGLLIQFLQSSSPCGIYTVIVLSASGFAHVCWVDAKEFLVTLLFQVLTPIC